MDTGSEVSGDTVSLTYQQLAERLGIDMQSARRRVVRNKWPRTTGNDGRARVQVPASILPVASTSPLTVAHDISPDDAASEAGPNQNVIPIRPGLPANDTATPEALSQLMSQVAELADLRGRLGTVEGEAEALREGIASARAQAAVERAARERAERELTFLQGQEAALRAEMAREREKAAMVAQVDAAVREELDRLKIERETIQKLGFLGRLAWAIRGSR